MKQRFSTRFDPPAPVLRVKLRARPGQPFEQLEALVDTGADICGVPEAVVDMLGLRPARVARVAGVLGESEAIVYRVDVELGGTVFPKLEALAIARPYALLGRNAQRRWWLGLDGPRGQLEVRWR